MNVYYTIPDVVIEDVDKVIDTDAMNAIITSLLVKTKCIQEREKINRCARYNEFVIISGHSYLRGELLYDFILSVLDSYKYAYSKIDKLSEDSLIYLDRFLTKKSNVTDIYGGKLEDSVDIDPNIKNLCDSLNFIEGVETFSSCEGHGTKERTLYVLFKIKYLDKLEEFTKKLSESIRVAHDKYPFDTQRADIFTTFNYGMWENMKGIYFEIRMRYEEQDQLIIFDYVKELSIELNKRFIGDDYNGSDKSIRQG